MGVADGGGIRCYRYHVMRWTRRTESAADIIPEIVASFMFEDSSQMPPRPLITAPVFGATQSPKPDDGDYVLSAYKAQQSVCGVLR
jgi:hypothetical protein